eukprot:CAMPEP_0195116866 /NCGR_PEP_ID=MMETSP0448-20130528/113014_1 /TAXON_ID=66468 /ORGANISM="Heterocapsa triquestra, Strain CCMP 448" /LENGTH=78 /DNA_ID=CAMNT_0040154057 /DNA_START=1 /DNA_END=234 /DNA_ORIENTATION=+
MTRPGSSFARPPSAMSTGYDAGEDQQDQATPTSAVNLRQKMLQQRNRTLQKQRSTGGLTTGSMVMANDSLPATEAAPS